MARLARTSRRSAMTSAAGAGLPCDRGPAVVRCPRARGAQASIAYGVWRCAEDENSLEGVVCVHAVARTACAYWSASGQLARLAIMARSCR
jgi:hypothetical protein